jgi:signal transduction histidine kinase
MKHAECPIWGDQRDHEALKRMRGCLPSVIWSTDSQLRIRSAVGRESAVVAMRPDQVGMTLEEYFQSEGRDPPPVSAHRRALLGESVAFEANWHGHRYRACVTPLRGDQGQIVGCIGFAQPIADRRRVGEAPRDALGALGRQREDGAAGSFKAKLPTEKQSEEHNRLENGRRQESQALCERVKELKCLYDLSYLFARPAVSLDEILQRTVELIPPAWEHPEITCARIILDDRQYTTENFSETAWKQACEICVRGGRIGTLEVCYLEEKEARDEGPFLQEKRSLLDEIADRLGRVVERLRTEESLRASRDFLTTVINAIPEPTTVVGLDRRVLLANRAARKMARGKDPASEGLTCYQLSHDREVPCGGVGQPCPLEQAAASKLPVTVTHAHYDADGREVIVEVRAAPVFDRAGEVVQIVASARDVTERRQGEQERERLLAELEAKNAELERFTYTVSHDLKSPLITVEGYLGYLEKDVANGRADRVQTDVSRVRSATQKMHGFLDELLALSRVGRVANPTEEVALGNTVREALSLVAGPIAERKVRVEVAGDLPVVFGDHRRLVEVFQNLIENAVKFMGDQPRPRVEIGASEDREEVVCYVRDNGVGINPRYHQRVFELFDKLDPKSDGTGVGLALVKRIVEVHGGRIWVESEGQGHGCSFCLVLPRKGNGLT